MLWLLLMPAIAVAHANGIEAQDCNGCHGGGATPKVSIAFSSLVPDGGATVHLTVKIQAVNGGGGGMFLTASNGAFAITDEAYTYIDGNGAVLQKQPKPASAGYVTFNVDWSAPQMAGGATFDVAALSANLDGDRSGDGGGTVASSLAYGCGGGTTFYEDVDGDGYGRNNGSTTVACAAPDGFAATNDDCNDINDAIHPGAAELCNGKDDNCDGQADEGLAGQTFYADGDSDGYGRLGGAAVTGCPGSGYGTGRGDCDDTNPDVHPGGHEVCNGKDDDCDGTIDENVKPECGVGACVNAAFGCDASSCRPKDPGHESCNLIDDDCNGIVDDGDACPAGKTCVLGTCKADTSESTSNTASSGGSCSAIDVTGLGLLAIIALVLRRAVRAR